MQGVGFGVVAARGAFKANAAAFDACLHEGSDSELVFELSGRGLVVPEGPADGELIMS